MQAIRCVCPSCHTTLKVTRTAGGQVRCPRCSSRISTNAPAPAPAPPVVPAVRTREVPRPASNNLPLILGLAGGGALVLLAVLAVVAVVVIGAMKPSSTAVAQATQSAQLPQPFPPPNPNPGGPAINPNPGNGPGGGGPAGGPALPEEQQAKVNAAIDKGVAYLKRALDGKGGGDAHANRLGAIALGALTLLTCGVPENDPILAKAIDRVRREGDTTTNTYDLALCILALDPLNGPGDAELIRSMALRLMAGQNAAGGWTYNVRALSDDDERTLLGLLRKFENPGAMARKDEGPGGGRVEPGAIGGRIDAPPADRNPPRPGRPAPPAKRPRLGAPLGPGGVENLPVVVFDLNKPMAGQDDNSNTQFAILAVWAAGKHGVPVHQSMRMIDARFRGSQNGDGSWGYHRGGSVRPDSMTCAGLIGLAVGKGIDAKKAGGKDEVIDRAVESLSKNIGKAPLRGRNGQALRLNMNSLGDLYYLWSLERVAVIYDAKEIGGKDWYGWGAQFLVEKQGPEGAWRDSHGGIADTCFALLFLKRANVAKDLTRQIGDLNLLGRVGGQK